VLADNRNGTIRDSNNDAFFYKSTNGGTTWIGRRASTTTARRRRQIGLRPDSEQHRRQPGELSRAELGR
jgi:hypothetical protein